MAFKKGDKKPKSSGRKQGSLNKTTKTVKETVLAVFNSLQDDKIHNLQAWAKTEPTEFYKLASKLIPTEINANIEEKITFNVGFKKTDSED